MWVAGLEADGTWQGDSGFSFRTVYGEQAWSAGLRARLGLLAMHNVLFYGTVGWTVGAFDYSDTYPAFVGLTGTTFTGQGLQFGGGIEAFLTPHVSARVEALYSDYGSHAIHYTGAPFVTVTPHTLEARFGLSWHLN
jgi:opacity protein-like surface antigen